MNDLKPGARVVLSRIPPSLLGGLPSEDEAAIQAVVGKPVTLVGFSFGQAELEFTDSDGDEHTIWVDAELISPA
jgi:hypothetical protein